MGRLSELMEELICKICRVSVLRRRRRKEVI